MIERLIDWCAANRFLVFTGTRLEADPHRLGHQEVVPEAGLRAAPPSHPDRQPWCRRVDGRLRVSDHRPQERDRLLTGPEADQQALEQEVQEQRQPMEAQHQAWCL
jgi:hypothetical protein